MDILGFFQRLGRASRLPTVALPVATLLLRLGQPDLLDIPFIAQADGAIFDNLALIFAIGVASDWSKDSAGVAALVDVVNYFVLTKAVVTINPAINTGALAGIITDLVGGAAYNRWSGIKLPDFLSFFGSKRFVPTATGLFCLVLAVIFGYVWLSVQNVAHAGSEWIVGAGALGSGIFGFVNRLLILTGLHQVLNTIAWLQIGEFTNAAGTVFYNDINHFHTGDGTTDTFMSGFFPIMAFDLPGAALAMYFAAPKVRRPMAGGMLLSVAITTFLTGIIEPLELLFMFLVLPLYFLYALLTGISLSVATLLGIHAGFSFPAGTIDYMSVYNPPAANQDVWMLAVMRLVFFAIYFVLFSAIIRMFDLKTPGREDREDDIVIEEVNSNTEEGLAQLATNYIAAIDGTDNLKATDTCITCLRLTAADSGRVNDAACKRSGASGVVKLNKQTIQVIVGAKAKSIGDKVKKVVARDPVAAASGESAPATVAPVAKPQIVANVVTVEALASSITGDVAALDQVPDEAFISKAVGDGVAVKPTDKIVVIPAAGTIVKIFNTNHMFCLEAVKGMEIVVHMGIDIVALEGKGFKCLVEEGTEVAAGQPILEMDLEFLNANARSMISPVVCSNSDNFDALVIKTEGHVVAGQTLLYEIKGK